jgi:hypothetical protein
LRGEHAIGFYWMLDQTMSFEQRYYALYHFGSDF